MTYYIAAKPWENRNIKETPETTYHNRRKLLKQLGLAAGSLLTLPFITSCDGNRAKNSQTTYQNLPTPEINNNFNFAGMEKLYPAKRNSRYQVTDRSITAEYDATHKNNFYEFISREDPDIYNVYKFVDEFDNRDWKIEVSGLVEKPGTYYLEELIKKFGIEERLYRFRCVERWSMAVPWSGFSFRQFINFLSPKSSAKYVRLYTYKNANQMEGVRNLTHYPWPYTEGLAIEEAMHELAFLATGIYGKPLPKQNGAPIRLVVPWKYGYKNIKSIVKIEFGTHQPETFWHKVAPKEYPFISNVDPEVPHPRWSQAYEKMIPDGELRPTLKFNGYGDLVANLY